MAEVELIMPKMGESIAEATILKWLKNEGDTIETDDSVLEIATDKVDSEVPSPISGKLVKILFQEGDVVAVGKAVAIISTGGDGDAPVVEKISEPSKVEEAKVVAEVPYVPQEKTETIKNSASNKFYSPLVLNIAREEKISMAELEAISGSGSEGRVTKKDIIEYVANKGSQPVQAAPVVAQKAAAPAPSGAVQQSATTLKTSPTAGQNFQSDVTVFPGDEIIEMDRMRKLIADHMVMSKHVSPHVTSFVEVDVTNMVKWRDRVKNEFEKREGEKITFTPLFIESVINAIKDFPMINVSVAGTQIIKRKNINIGMAAALPTGNLIVPVIKNADTKNLVGLTKSVNDLANRARNNKLSPDDIQGGTFTVTNVGGFGNLMGTPIINQPQVAILALGAIKKKPVVLETADGDVIAIRHMMFLSLSYDHRVVDGMLGGSFLRRVADNFEAFDKDRKI